MRKSIKFILAAGFLFAMLFSCSNDDIKLPDGLNPSKPSQGDTTLVYCYIESENKCSRDEGLKISKELCEEVGGKAVTSCNSEYGEIPDFVCKWDEEEYAINEIATLSFDMKDNGDPNCERKIVSVFYNVSETLDFEELGEIIVNDSVSRLKISGYLYCSKDDPDDPEKKLEVSSDLKSCGSFELSQISPPRTTGRLVINRDYPDPTMGDIYYIGSTPAITDSSLVITNKAAALCDDVKYAWKGRSTAKAGDTVKVVATADCNGEERELASAMAVVVPDPVLSDCVWDSTGIIMYDSISPTRRRNPIMHEDQTLKISATLSNNYGRCGPNVLYSFNSDAAPSVNDTLSLKGLATYGESSSKALSAKAVASCPRNTIPDKVCARVADVYVAYHVNKKGSCGDGDGIPFTIKSGITIFEFACEEEKNPANKDDLYNAYYINCDGNEGNFTVAAEGGTVQGNGHNGWNFIGQTVSKDPVDNLYHYPVPALIRTSVSAGLTCKIW